MFLYFSRGLVGFEYTDKSLYVNRSHVVFIIIMQPERNATSSFDFGSNELFNLVDLFVDRMFSSIKQYFSILNVELKVKSLDTIILKVSLPGKRLIINLPR